MARTLDRYFHLSRIPQIRLLGGSVTDNLGVRGSIMGPFSHYDNVADMAGVFTPESLDRVTNVLVIVGNAQVYNEFDWSRSGREPPIWQMLESSFAAAVDILSTETVSLANGGFQIWADQINAGRKSGSRKVTVHFATLTFNDIKGSKNGAHLNAIPTSRWLPARDIDELEALAESQVRDAPEIRAFIQSLR